MPRGGSLVMLFRMRYRSRRPRRWRNAASSSATYSLQRPFLDEVLPRRPCVDGVEVAGREMWRYTVMASRRRHRDAVDAAPRRMDRAGTSPVAPRSARNISTRSRIWICSRRRRCAWSSRRASGTSCRSTSTSSASRRRATCSPRASARSRTRTSRATAGPGPVSCLIL